MKLPLDLKCGSTSMIHSRAREVPAFDAPFDKILAVNALLFWKSPTRALRRSVSCCAPAA